MVNRDTGRSSVRITVKPAGIIRRYVREQEMDVPAGFTSAALIEQLGIPSRLKMLSLVNGRRRPLDAELDDGDQVRLVALVWGG
jgi:sulfur carrier protein ThiS